MRGARGHFWREPKVWADGDEHGIRPDAIIHGRSMPRTMVDVSIVNCTNASYTAGKRTVAALLLRRSTEKHTKYKALAASEQCDFKAFVFDSYGTLGKDTRDLLRLLASSHSDMPEEEDAFYLQSLRSLSFALQAGNAHISATGCERVRAARPSARAAARR